MTYAEYTYPQFVPQAREHISLVISIQKLLAFDGYRVVGLRGVQFSTPPPGIHEIIAIPIREPSREEVSDKRTVNRDPHLRPY